MALIEGPVFRLFVHSFSASIGIILLGELFGSRVAVAAESDDDGGEA